MSGFNEVLTSTVYCGVKVSMKFKDGNVVMGRSARLQTDNPFAQDAIEHDQRFAWGNIKLVNVVEIGEDEDSEVKPQSTVASAPAAQPAQKKGKKGKAETEPQTQQTEQAEVVESVKTLNDLDAWFAEKGVTLEGSSKSYIAGLCEHYNVVFPNLKY